MKRIGKTHAWLALIAASLLILAAGPGRAQSNGEACFLEGLREAVRCHEITVPLDHDAPDGETITLFAAVLSAREAGGPPDPLFLLAGGPGQAASTFGALVNQSFDRVRRRRDIVLLDQRGTGRSNRLPCDMGDNVFQAFDAALIEDTLRTCADEAGLDVRYFQTEDAARDLDRVRSVLGYDQINLWGASYGTRMALHYMKRFPDQVRTAVLDGITSPTQPLFTAASGYAQDALDSLLTDCAADPACGEAFPSLDEDVTALLGSFADEARPIEIVGVDGVTRQTVFLSGDILAEAIRGALYTPQRAALLPYALTRAARYDDFAPLGAMLYDSLAFSLETMATGLTYAVLCTEDIAATSLAEAQEAGADSFHGDLYYRIFSAGCGGWPSRPAPADYAKPVRADMPVLALSGALDPITPPKSAEEALQYLPNATHLIAPGAGHNVTPVACTSKLIARFVDDPSAELDASCLDETRRPPFTISSAGPRP